MVKHGTGGPMESTRNTKKLNKPYGTFLSSLAWVWIVSNIYISLKNFPQLGGDGCWLEIHDGAANVEC